MRRVLRILLVVGGTLASSCAVYDAELLDNAFGGESSDDLEVSDGAGGGVGTGGDSQGGDGGGTPDGGGAQSSGGMGGTGSGGDDPVGGDTGSGGEPSDCEAPSGTKMPHSGGGESLLVEDFNTSWVNINGPAFDGQWFVADDGDGTGLPTQIQDAYKVDPCFVGDDQALHVKGSGYNTWGASFDANLMFDVKPSDQSAYDGVILWARSDDADQIRVGFSDDDDSNGTSPIESTPRLLTTQWKSFEVPFPAAVNTEKLTVIHVVAIADAEFDFWIDDLMLYAE